VTNRKPHCLVLSVSFLLSVLLGGRNPLEAQVQLFCPEGLEGREGKVLTVSCVVKNASQGDIHLLADDFVLEGPRSATEPYVYNPAGRSRIENVVEYGARRVGQALPGNLFHPVNHLTFQQLGLLIQVPKGRSQRIDIAWPLAEGSYPTQGTWWTRISVTYIDERHLRELQAGEDLSVVCRKALQKSLASLKPWPSTLAVSVTRRTRKEFSDQCREVISERFQHVQSTVLSLKVR
jgi:hypothetical protein